MIARAGTIYITINEVVKSMKTVKTKVVSEMRIKSS